MIVNDAHTEVRSPAGCSLSFRVGRRIVPVGALLPNSEHPETGLHVDLAEETYEFRVLDGLSRFRFEGCDGTEAAALVSEGFIDEMTLSIDVEPSDVLYLDPPVGVSDGSIERSGEGSADARAHWVYGGNLELRGPEARLRMPMHVLWMPHGGPGDLRERSEEELVWDHLTTGYTFLVPED